MSKTARRESRPSLLKRVAASVGVDGLRSKGDAHVAGVKSYHEWRQWAQEQDEKSGMAEWRGVERTRLYDFAEIRERHDKLRRMLDEHDDHGLLFALNEGVHGNMGGMGNPELYQRAKSGTKALISDYIEAICEGIEHLDSCDNVEISAIDKADFFSRAQLCFGRTALMLSGGGIYGNFHVGVVKVLVDQRLLPSVISGSSAGSLIAAIAATHTPNELRHLLLEKHLQIEPGRTTRAMKGILPRFEVEQVARHIERLLPDLTFAEAVARTGIHLNVSVSPAEVHQMPRLLNAVTAPNVFIRSAVLASCSVPGVFPPAMLVAKNRDGKPQPYLPARRWYDGSMSDDIPAKRLARLYDVNHFIVSQVNPFALALSRPRSKRLVPYEAWLKLYRQSSLELATAMQTVVRHYHWRWPRLNFGLNAMISVLEQEYQGDINIYPDLGTVKPWRGMASPTEAQLREIIEAGERATWPKVEMIRDRTKIAHLLDRIVQRREGHDLSGHHLRSRGHAPSTLTKRKVSTTTKKRG